MKKLVSLLVIVVIILSFSSIALGATKTDAVNAVRNMGLSEYYVVYAQNYFDLQISKGRVFTSAAYDTVITQFTAAANIAKAYNPEALIDPTKYDKSLFPVAKFNEMQAAISAGAAVMGATVVYGKNASGVPYIAFKDSATGVVYGENGSTITVSPSTDTTPRTTGFEVDTMTTVGVSIIVIFALAAFSVLFMKRREIVQ